MAKFKLASCIIGAGMLLGATTSSIADTGRYTMTTTKDGILRLDTRSGAVALCSRASKGWSCTGIDDKGLQNRIDVLEKENAQLRAQLDASQLSPVPNDSGKMELPSEEDVDKAMDFMEKLLNRFKGMVEDLKKDKKDEEGVPL